jgi:hypothetical protein
MTIYRLNREQLSTERVVPYLFRLWDAGNRIVLNLRDTSRAMTTTELLSRRDDFAANYADLNAFKSAYGEWFAARYSDGNESAALDGALTSMVAINGYINSMLQNNYWDAQLDNPVAMEMSQADRNTLADQIETQLE